MARIVERISMKRLVAPEGALKRLGINRCRNYCQWNSQGKSRDTVTNFRSSSRRWRPSRGALIFAAGTIGCIALSMSLYAGDRLKAPDLSSNNTDEKRKSGHPVVDVVVVGGGIAGLSYSLAASQLGASVSLLERSTTACEASSLAAGVVSVIGPGENVQKPDFFDFIPYLTRLRALQLIQKYNLDPQMTSCSVLYVASDDEQANYAKNWTKSLTTSGYDVRYLENAADVVKVEPLLEGGPIVAAVEAPMSFHVNPNSFSAAMADAAIMEGVSIHEKEEVTGIVELPKLAVDGARFVVETGTGKYFRCRNVVVASGCAVTKTLGLCGVSDAVIPKVVPVKGQVWATDVIGETGKVALRTALLGLSGLVYWDQVGKLCSTESLPPACTHDADMRRLTHHVYGRMTPEGQILFGGDRILDLGKDYKVMDEQMEENYDYIVSLIPALKDVERAGSYCCYMPFSIDGVPIVGCVRPGLWVLGGFGPNGITLAAGTSQLLAMQMFSPSKLNEREKHVLAQVNCHRRSHLA